MDIVLCFVNIVLRRTQCMLDIYIPLYALCSVCVRACALARVRVRVLVRVCVVNVWKPCSTSSQHKTVIGLLTLYHFN